MTDFTRQPDEEPAAWLERLLTAGMGDLTNAERIHLASHIQAAQQAAGWVYRMPAVRAPEELADSLIDVAPTTPGGPLSIHLKGTTATVFLGPYETTEAAYDDALKVREFFAEVIRTAAELTLTGRIGELLAADPESRAKSEFLTGMSHEIHTPMKSVLGTIELTLNTDLRPEQRELLLAAQASAEALRSIITDVFDFYRRMAGKPPSRVP